MKPQITYLGVCESKCIYGCNSYTYQERKEDGEIVEKIYSCYSYGCEKKEKLK